MNTTRTTTFEFMSHLRAWKSPRRISVASGEAMQVAHLEGDSPRQGALRGRLGVSKHGSFLSTEKWWQMARLPAAETHNFGDKWSSWCFKSKGETMTSNWGLYINLCIHCSENKFIWIHFHTCCSSSVFSVCYYRKKLIPEGEDVDWHWRFLVIRSQFIVRRQQFGIPGWSEGCGQVLTGGGLDLRRTKADRSGPLRRDGVIRCDWVLG